MYDIRISHFSVAYINVQYKYSVCLHIRMLSTRRQGKINMYLYRRMTETYIKSTPWYLLRAVRRALLSSHVYPEGKLYRIGKSSLLHITLLRFSHKIRSTATNRFDVQYENNTSNPQRSIRCKWDSKMCFSRAELSGNKSYVNCRFSVIKRTKKTDFHTNCGTFNFYVTYDA